MTAPTERQIELMAHALGAARMEVVREKPKFEKEADLCAAFIAAIPESWTAYPETGGFDILVVRKEDGFQIGVEAKLKLNAKVICQAAERSRPCYVMSSGPDCRAVLIPAGVSEDLASLCDLIGLTIIRQEYTVAQIEARNRSYNGYTHFTPTLPRFGVKTWTDEHWFELCPAERLHVPAYVPDVKAGDAAPVMLTPWKVAAIKIVALLERNGSVTRQDFKDHDISMSRWTQGRWLRPGPSHGRWIRGEYMPDFKGQHPVNFDQIVADFEKWDVPTILERLLAAVPEACPKRARDLIRYNDGDEAVIIDILKRKPKL